MEDKSVSYWLKKLFDQRAQKVIDDKKLAERKLASRTENVENNSTRLKPKKQLFKQDSPDEKGQGLSEKSARDKHLTNELVRKSNREVFSISTVFPWDLFPTTIRIQENKVSFIYHQFMSSQEQDVDIKDISNTHIEQSIFFAKLKIISNTFANQPVIIDHLRKKEAQQARMYIQGLQLFCQKNIDTSDYEITELRQKLEELQTFKHNHSK